MKTESRQLKRVDLVKVSGRVDSSNAHELEKEIKGIMGRGQYRLVLDLSELSFISSGGIRVLITGAKTTRRWNRGDLRLAGLPKQIHETFELAGLTPVFRIYPSTVEAVGSF